MKDELIIFHPSSFILHPFPLVGLSRLELLTFPLSEGCSNQLSYRPSTFFTLNNSRVTGNKQMIDILTSDPYKGSLTWD